MKLYSKKKFSDLGCYAQRFGARGYGHIGISSIGLMSDIKDKEWQRYFAIPKCSFLFHFYSVFRFV